MPFRFLHTADLHLDSPLRSLALRDPSLAEAVGSATRAAVLRIVDLCLAEAVDALLIAGDLYDGDQTSIKTARFLSAQFARLDAAGIQTFVIRGNHDAMSRLGVELVLPPSVHVFGARARSHVLAPEAWLAAGRRPVAIHGLSFAKPQAPESLLPLYPPPMAGAWNIGLMHSSLGGAEGHDVYAPVSLADLRATGYDYWALGHVHRRAVHEGAVTVVMPGMPQGRDIGEAGEKSVTLVTLPDDGGRPILEARPTALVRFERVEVVAAGLEDWPDFVGRLGQALRDARRDLTADALVLRPTISGAGGRLAARLRRDADLILAEAQEAAAAIGSVWIDKVELGPAPEIRSVDAGAVAELAGLARGEGADWPAQTLTEGQAALDALAKVLPAPLRDLLGQPEARGRATDVAGREAVLRQLLEEGLQEVLAHLAAVEGTEAP